MSKILLSAALVGALLFPGGAVFAQNAPQATLALPWRVAEPADSALGALLATAEAPASLSGTSSLSSPAPDSLSFGLSTASPAPAAQALAKESEPLQGSFRRRLLERTFQFLGVRYKWGGNKVEEGFDCSGFVRQVFADVAGLVLPRTAKEQSQVGTAVARHELKPGDLVFFNTMKRAFSHVGIYLGNNLFAHAPRQGKAIQVDNLSDQYWVETYQGARRPLAL